MLLLLSREIGLRAMRHKARRMLWAMGGVAAMLVAASPSALAQCAMCRAAISNSAEAASMASSMNLAVLVLLIPPVALFCAIFVVAYRYRKAPDESASSALQEQSLSRRAAVNKDQRDARVGRIRGDHDGPPATTIAEAT